MYKTSHYRSPKQSSSLSTFTHLYQRSPIIPQQTSLRTGKITTPSHTYSTIRQRTYSTVSSLKQMSNYSNSTPPTKFKVHLIPCHSDNYAYAILGNDQHLAVIDGSEPKRVMKALEDLGIDLSNEEQQKKTLILTTHKHWDHSNGNSYFANTYPHIPIVGGVNDDVPHVTKTVKDGDRIPFGEDVVIDVMETPCHTSGHVCYLFSSPAGSSSTTATDHKSNEKEHALFSGDTLFVAGCGRFFEGTADEMFANMQKFRALPDSTLVYTGHEYTLSNLKFATQVDPSNLSIQHQLAWCQANPSSCTQPSTIALEKQTNVFMRAPDVKTLGMIRTMKDKNQPHPIVWKH